MMGGPQLRGSLAFHWPPSEGANWEGVGEPGEGVAEAKGEADILDRRSRNPQQSRQRGSESVRLTGWSTGALPGTGMPRNPWPTASSPKSQTSGALVSSSTSFSPMAVRATAPRR